MSSQSLSVAPRARVFRAWCGRRSALYALELATVASALLLLTAPPVAALCGDMSGDGTVAASDALVALKDAVAGDYRAVGDVAPPGAPDGLLSATDALAILLAAVEKRIPRCAAATATRAFIATASSLFDAAGVAVMDLDGQVVASRNGASHRDSVARTQAGRAFVINRFGANSLLEIDPDGAALPVIKECSVSDGFDSNPHDFVLLSPEKGYVTLYEGAELLVIDPRSLDPAVDPPCANLISGHVDLSSLADDDGMPEMDQMRVVGDRLFVLLQILDQDAVFRPAGPARLAVVDTTDDSLVGSVELELTNPFAETKGLIYDDARRRLYVGGPGRVFADFTDGGIEAVNVDTLESEGVLMTGAELGGDLFDFVIVGDRRAYAIVAYADETNSVVELDLDRREVVLPELLSSAEMISDIELTETGELWVAFREDSGEATPGVRIFSIADNGEITDEPIYPGSLPFNITFLD